MSEYFGVKIEVDGINEARIERIRDAVCKEWEFEEDEICFSPSRLRLARMLAISMGVPGGMETQREFAERMAAAVWNPNGGYCEVKVSIEDAANVCVFGEHDYRRIMKRGHQWAQSGDKMNFIFGLFDEDELIDQTSLDENDLELAEELFFGEFGHEQKKNHVVHLIAVCPEEESQRE